MKRMLLVVAMSLVLGSAAQAQRGGRGGQVQVPMGGDALDTVEVLSARDSAIFRGRITAAKSPYSDCQLHAFQSCASGDVEARLSADGTAYGVLMTRYDGKAAYLWKLSARATGAGDGAGGGGRRRGGGGARGAKRRG